MSTSYIHKKKSSADNEIKKITKKNIIITRRQRREIRLLYKLLFYDTVTFKREYK